MSIPVFLASSYRYLMLTAVTDVQTIIDNVVTELAANDPPWTDNGYNMFTSPMSWGQFITIDLSRVDALTLRMMARDTYGGVLTTKQLCITSALAFTVRIFTGKFHFVVDVQMADKDGEAIWAGVLDLYPENQDAHPNIQFANGSRNTSNGLSENSAAQIGINMGGTYGIGAFAYTPRGAVSRNNVPVVRPIECWGSRRYGYDDWHFAGRMHQMLFVPNRYQGDPVTAPIDVDNPSSLATFIVLGGPGAIGVSFRIAVRVS